MSISTKQLRAQLEAACVLMEGDTTTIEKIEKLKVLLSGINPTLDSKLDSIFKAYGHLKSSLQGDVIHLSLQGLPESSPVEKKRKKLLAIFITSWKSLKSEVASVQGYYDNVQSGAGSTAGSIAKTGLFAKGPLGFITLAAVVIVGINLFLKQATTTIEIENIACPPIIIPSNIPITIPGLRLPASPIISGSPVPAQLPAISIEVNATTSLISATILGQTGNYSLPKQTKDIRFDGQSLLNKTTTLQLGNSASHTLVIECK